MSASYGVFRTCLGGCGRTLGRANQHRCVHCKAAHVRAQRQVTRNEQRAGRRPIVTNDISAAQIEKLLAAGDAKRRRARWRAA